MTSPSTESVQKVAEADFPSEFGHFRIYGFLSGADEAVVLTMGDVKTPEPVLLRIHSQCLTGDVFHSLRCDCQAQLEVSLRAIAELGRGMMIYEAKEGRGIGLINKLRAYELQDAGADTVEANVQLGFEPDLRNYELPGAILKWFGVAEVRLLSNNPEKIKAVEAAGVRVVERVPCTVDAVESRTHYLRTKKEKMGHLLDIF